MCINSLFNSPIGKLIITSLNDQLVSIDLYKDNTEIVENNFNSSVKKQLESYFTGNRQEFEIPIDYLQGTDFQKKVWNELKKIPYGKTLFYKDIAQKINHPKAYRAVGSAIGKNPIPIIIPCHRVINSSGNIGKFSMGEGIKPYLLNLEQ